MARRAPSGIRPRPRARFLVGETYFRSKDFEKPVPEFEAFVTLYPSNQIADLGQYRLARSFFDQMPTVERDQKITAQALQEFQKLIRLYPESRYAPDAIVKIESCRLRLAQKELWIAAFYVQQGKYESALPRFDTVIKDTADAGGAGGALPEGRHPAAAGSFRRGRGHPEASGRRVPRERVVTAGTGAASRAGRLRMDDGVHFPLSRDITAGC